MASDEGGRWDVGIKDNAVFLLRVSESNDRLFEASLEPDEARALADLLNKFAGKADESSGEDKDDDDEDDTDNSDEDSDKDKDDADADKDKDDEDDDENDENDQDDESTG
jgi:hypothetical protein